MAKRISNQDLHEQLKDFKVESNRKFDSISEVIMELQKDFREMHDWWVGKKAIDERFPNSANVTQKDLLKIIISLITLMGTAFTIIQLVINK